MTTRVGPRSVAATIASMGDVAGGSHEHSPAPVKDVNCPNAD